MMYDWYGRFFQGRLILWYFQFPAGINQSRVADQFPVQGDDLGHGAAVLSGDFPEGVALSDDVSHFSYSQAEQHRECRL